MTSEGDPGQGGNEAAADPVTRPAGSDPPIVPDRRWGQRPKRNESAPAQPTGERRRRWEAGLEPRSRPDAPTITGQPEKTSGGPVHEPSPPPPPPPGGQARRVATVSASPASTGAAASSSGGSRPPALPERGRSGPPAAPPPAIPVSEPAERRGGVAVGDLAQQLAAVQAQVASLSAQLTTLAHRITYDMERGAQTTSERILRDLSQLPQQVSYQVGAHLGPAIDDLTDQVESDSARLTEVVDVRLAARLTTIADAVQAMPLANVELLSNIETVGVDLQDRFERFSTRIADQVTALERATTAELTRLRDHVDELQASASQPGLDHDVLARMAGQVERMVQRSSGTSEVVDAVELLINEHLEVLRDGIETRVGALAPALSEELEALRADALAGVTASDEALGERVDALESSLGERVDAALAEQIDVLEGLVADRHMELLTAVSTTAEERQEELAGLVALANERIEAIHAAVRELQTSGAGAGGSVDEEAMAAVTEELQALRRRITLRFESGDAPAGLTPQQLQQLADAVAERIASRH